MSISFVKELSGRGGTIGEDSERKLIFQSDSALDTEYDVYQNRNCPKIGSRHPNRRFSLFFLKRGDLSITQSDSNWARWDVEATYTQLEPGEPEPEEEQDFNEPSQDESDQPDFNPDVSVEFEDYTTPLNFAVNTTAVFDADSPGGTGAYPVVNSALEPYNPPPEVFRQNTIIRVSRNLALSSSLWSDALDLKNTINTDTFSWRRGPAKITVQPKQCRIKTRFGNQIEYRSKTGKKSFYANLEVQFTIKPETWNIDLLDVGTVYLSTAGKSVNLRINDDDWSLASGTTQIPITDDENNRVQGLLNGSGIQVTTGGNSFFNRYPGYYEAKHSAFFKRLTRRAA